MKVEHVAHMAEDRSVRGFGEKGQRKVTAQLAQNGDQ
jgi:hypothetical protein